MNQSKQLCDPPVEKRCLRGKIRGNDRWHIWMLIFSMRYVNNAHNPWPDVENAPLCIILSASPSLPLLALLCGKRVLNPAVLQVSRLCCHKDHWHPTNTSARLVTALPARCSWMTMLFCGGLWSSLINVGQEPAMKTGRYQYRMERDREEVLNLNSSFPPNSSSCCFCFLHNELIVNKKKASR